MKSGEAADEQRARRMGPAALAGEGVFRAAILGFVWWAVSEGAPASWTVGGGAVLLATIVSLWLTPAALPRPRLLPLLLFVPYFLRESIAGGSDVARRAYAPGLPLTPGITSYPVAAMGGAERVTFALVVNLLPGTLAAQLDGPVLHLHVLDTAMPVAENLAGLEARLAPVFGRMPERSAQ